MKKVFFGLLVLFAVNAASAQAYLNDPRYGDTPEQRTENAKLYAAFGVSFGLKDWPQATIELQKLLKAAPKVSENLYIKGIEMYRQKFVSAATDEEKKIALDSIMMLFDIRADVYQSHPTRGKGFVLSQKARMFMQLCPDDKQGTYKLFWEAIEATADKLDQDLVSQYFGNVTQSFSFDEIDMEEYMTRYENLSKLLKASADPAAPSILATIDATFASSGAASCENIEKIFRPKYEADPTNNDLLKQILGLFNHSKCQNPWQMELLEKYYENDPQPEFALMLAGVYEERKEYDKALEYINVAIANETEPAEKVKHMLRAAAQTLAMDKYRESADYCKKIFEIDPDNGMANNFYASAVAGAVNTGCSGFDKQAAYWLVVDYYSKALSLIPEGDPQRDDIKKAIAVYSGNFPKKDELFMRAMENGTPYNVSCGWVSGRTTVRGRN